jgi:glycerophosphoryl diester phosphodiesterase
MSLFAMSGAANDVVANPASASRSDFTGKDARGSRPIVIGHRGASGYRPEHTLASYRLAIDLGADFIEPDLVSTKDGCLVARHENEISGTTDVAEHPEFAARKTNKTIDGRTAIGFFTEDFTLAELKTLRARERLPELRPHNTRFDRQLEIPTWTEVIALAQTESRARGRSIGLYPETKHPSYFESIGLPLEDALLHALHAAGYAGPTDPVFIQSFETRNLQKLRALTGLRLIQLIDQGLAPFDFIAAGDARTYADLLAPDGLAFVAGYADGIGVHKDLVVPRDAEQRLLPATRLIEHAHARRLAVHAWTFRAENFFLPADFRIGDAAATGFAAARGDLHEELKLFLRLGLDGVFCDQPDIAVATRTGLGSF